MASRDSSRLGWQLTPKSPTEREVQARATCHQTDSVWRSFDTGDISTVVGVLLQNRRSRGLLYPWSPNSRNRGLRPTFFGTNLVDTPRRHGVLFPGITRRRCLSLRLRGRPGTSAAGIVFPLGSQDPRRRPLCGLGNDWWASAQALLLIWMVVVHMPHHGVSQDGPCLVQCLSPPLDVDTTLGAPLEQCPLNLGAAYETHGPCVSS